VLQEKTFERVGSSEPVRVDVRIVAATHQNLERLIQQERFREDLYYRLNVIPITAPPLRQRREDVPELVQHFLRQLSGQTGRAAPEVDDDALEALRAFDWPGNIRQLRNLIERTLVVAEGATITLNDLPEEIRSPRAPGDTGEPRSGVRRFVRSSKEQRLKREREELEQALVAARGNKAEAARALGIPRSTLLSRMQKHGIT
jgi:DNA-binding NtrC family response regulator